MIDSLIVVTPAATPEQSTVVETPSTFDSEIHVTSRSFSDGNRPIIDTTIPNPTIGFPTEYTTINDRVIGTRSPTSELGDPTQADSITATAGPRLLSRISKLEQETSELKQEISDLKHKLSARSTPNLPSTPPISPASSTHSPNSLFPRRGSGGSSRPPLPDLTEVT